MIVANVTEVFRWHNGELDVSRGWAAVIIALVLVLYAMKRDIL